MLVVALLVVAVVALIIGFGRITRRPRSGEDVPGRPEASASPPPGAGDPDGETTTDDPLPTDPPEGRP
jgi:hypothetical protein